MNYKKTINKVQSKYRRLYANKENTLTGFFCGVIITIIVCLFII